MLEEGAMKVVEVLKNRDDAWGNAGILQRKRGGREPWLSVYGRACTFRSKLVFHHFIGRRIGHKGGDPKGTLNPTEVVAKVERSGGPSWQGVSVAVCQDVMKEGKHYAEFTITQGWDFKSLGMIQLGVVRPLGGWDLPDIHTIPVSNWIWMGSRTSPWDGQYPISSMVEEDEIREANRMGHHIQAGQQLHGHDVMSTQYFTNFAADSQGQLLRAQHTSAL